MTNCRFAFPGTAVAETPPPGLRLPVASPLTSPKSLPVVRRTPSSGREVAIMVTFVGRPEKPLSTKSGPLDELASELRDMRELAGLTYCELAAETGKVVSTLTSAVAGKRLPSWSVVRAWVQACGGDGDIVLGLYQRACAAAGRSAPARDLAGVVPPDPAAATTAAEFITEMIRLRAWAGISLRTLNLRSGGRLPPSTVSEALCRDRIPRCELVLDYARACGVRDDAIGEWERSWNVIKNALGSDLTQARWRRGHTRLTRVRRVAWPGRRSR